MATADAGPPSAAVPPPRRAGGWRVVAAKELGDHVSSVRFAILLALVGLGSTVAVYSTASSIRSVADQASGAPVLFLELFASRSQRIPFSFVTLIGLLGPLLGIAYGFDAINGERAQGTLPRLVSQPIYRDDVINGKFVAGLAVIALTIVSLAMVLAGVGIVRLGVVPTGGEVLRLAVYLAVALAYIGFWLALSVLFSVLMRRAATSALASIASWIVAALFAALLVGIVADVLAPVPEDATAQEQIRNARVELTIGRLFPPKLYEEATLALLHPDVRAVGIVFQEQVDRAIPSDLPLDQSLLIVWPQVTALVALTVLCFAGAYVAFMRQEIRA